MGPDLSPADPGVTVVRLIDATESDHVAVLELNEGALPHVSILSPDALAHLHEEAFYFRVARSEVGALGFLLALTETAAYDSANFLWFRERYERFVYIDRIVIGEGHRGMGLGRRLYADLAEAAGSHAGILSCEVNLRPPNPGSITFHRTLGFREVGQQDTEGSAKRVSLLIRRRRSSDRGGRT